MSYLNAKLAGSQFIRLSDTKTGFNGRDALPLLVIDTPFCQATIALQGAQVLTFQPTGETPWLWLSPYAQFEHGKSIRGGIPVCLPWFGVNRKNPEKPKHGFVRNEEWQLASWQENTNAVQLDFVYAYLGNRPDLFKHPFTAALQITLSNHLQLALQIDHHGSETAEFSWAFHTYFAVDDCRETTVSGLEGLHYLDNTQGLKMLLQDGPLHFLQEVDSVYNQATEPQVITAQHQLAVAGENCPTCIVWNAGEKNAATLEDIKGSYRNYVCVERGCAFNDSLNLASGAIFNSGMTISRVE